MVGLNITPEVQLCLSLSQKLAPAPEKTLFQPSEDSAGLPPKVYQEEQPQPENKANFKSNPKHIHDDTQTRPFGQSKDRIRCAIKIQKLDSTASSGKPQRHCYWGWLISQATKIRDCDMKNSDFKNSKNQVPKISTGGRIDLLNGPTAFNTLRHTYA